MNLSENDIKIRQKAVLDDCQTMIAWYDRNKRTSRTFFYVSQICTIVLSALTRMRFNFPKLVSSLKSLPSDSLRPIPPAMGLATAINFQPTGGGKAAITGDFVMIASEVNPVIKALRDNGIEVTALHSHMLTETPRLFFMHFWANDDAQKLARGLRAALDQMNIAKSQPK